MKVVLDTSVLVSALLTSDSIPRRLLQSVLTAAPRTVRCRSGAVTQESRSF